MVRELNQAPSMAADPLTVNGWRARYVISWLQFCFFSVSRIDFQLKNRNNNRTQRGLVWPAGVTLVGYSGGRRMVAQGGLLQFIERCWKNQEMGQMSGSFSPDF